MLSQLPDEFVQAFKRTYNEYKAKGNGFSVDSSNGNGKYKKDSKDKTENKKTETNEIFDDKSKNKDLKPEQVIMLDNDFESF